MVSGAMVSGWYNDWVLSCVGVGVTCVGTMLSGAMMSGVMVCGAMLSWTMGVGALMTGLLR